MRTLRIVMLALGMLAVAGCYPPEEPTLTTMDKPLVEVYRVAAPIPAPPPGRPQWSLYHPSAALIGEGKKLASLDFKSGSIAWTQELSDDYALTAVEGPHSALIVSDHTAVLLAGNEASDGPVAMRAFTEKGAIWEQRLPPAAKGKASNHVVLAGSGTLGYAIVSSHCDIEGCEMTGWDGITGSPLWKMLWHEKVQLFSGGVCDCVLVVGPESVAELGGRDGGVSWKVPRKPGPWPRVVRAQYRAILITPPQAPDCLVTLTATATDNDRGTQAWSQTLPWHDVGASSDLPCRYDPTRPIFRTQGGELVIPGDSETTLVNSYRGTTRQIAMAPKEFWVSGGLTWDSEAGYSDRDTPAQPRRLDVPPPADGKPFGTYLGGAWLVRSGRGWALHTRTWQRTAWRHEPCAVAAAPLSDRLIYTDRDQLVGVGP